MFGVFFPRKLLTVDVFPFQARNLSDKQIQDKMISK